MTESKQLLSDWFSKPLSDHWFNSTTTIDQQLKEKYETLWQAAVSNQLKDWLQTADGTLALIILLDQLPLNMFRGEAKSFSSEQQAVFACKHGLSKQFDQKIEINRRAFFYMPLMHSENLDDQNLCIKLFEQAGLENNLRFAKHHHAIIEKFGRFPHRNTILGRKSTADEINYLNSDKAFKG